MRTFLITISILLLLATIPLLWWKNLETTKDGFGQGQSTENFEIGRGFLQVAIRLSDEEIGRKINEASGCRIIQSTLIKKEKNGKIRHIVYERILEIDVAGNKRQIKVRDESKANVREGWIENHSYQIEPDAVVRNHQSYTKFSKSNLGTHVEMRSSVEIKGIPTLFVEQGVKSGLGKSRAEMIRQLK